MGVRGEWRGGVEGWMEGYESLGRGWEEGRRWKFMWE